MNRFQSFSLIHFSSDLKLSLKTTPLFLCIVLVESKGKAVDLLV